MYLLLQTTQPIDGMSHWGPMEWTLFFSAVGGFVTVLTTSVIAIIKASKAQSDTQSVAQAVSDKVPTTQEITAKVDAIARGTDGK